MIAVRCAEPGRAAAWAGLRAVVSGAAGDGGSQLSLLVLVAHPDDETIGGGALLGRLAGQVHVIHATRGVPRDLRWAPAAGVDGAAYGEVRRREAGAALVLAGISPAQVCSLDAVDQEVVAELPAVARRLAGLFRELAPDLVLTHPYEGGHPDHDALALAARAACALLQRAGATPPAVGEMAFYHAAPGGGFRAGELLPCGHSSRARLVLHLSPAERERKARMLACFASQRATLSQFPPPERETFRPAPAYDFTRPPHPGRLLYERWGFPLDGAGWRALARRGLAELGLDLGRAAEEVA